MEGKEVRFGIPASAMWAEATTVVSNGSVNSMHDSFSPLGGMVPLINIMLGEIIYGGVGAGMYGMLIFVFITVFFAGLMVGRTPEYIGKKIETREVQLSVLAVIGQTATILFFAAAAVVTKVGLASLNNQGPHGLSEILYAYSSAVGNNGSAFAGLRQHGLLQRDARHRDAHRPVHRHRAGARHRGKPGRQDADPAERRHILHEQCDLCHPARLTVLIARGR